MESDKKYGLEVGLGTSTERFCVGLTDGNSKEFYADPLRLKELEAFQRLEAAQRADKLDNADAEAFYLEIFNRRAVDKTPVTIEWIAENLHPAEVAKIVIYLSAGGFVTGAADTGNAPRQSSRTGASSSRNSRGTTGSKKRTSKT